MDIREMQNQAKMCLNCKNASCTKACPLNVKIPQFIKSICDEKLETAYQTIVENNYMGYICGMVCPHEKQCQGNCVRNKLGKPVQIGNIESTICEYGLENFKLDINMPAVCKEKVAVVGGGPSGLTCAFELRKKGYDVTIFEKNDCLGGVLIYGIPEYRLNKEIVNKIIDNMVANINVQTNITYGVDETYETLFKKGFKAVYLAIGNEVSKVLDIPGKDLEGVYGANEFLKNRLPCKDKKVVVIGGGNVAMDAARVAKRNGAKKVTIVYRRKLEDMPANKIEIEETFEENIEFIFERNVKEIKGEEKVTHIICDNDLKVETDILVMAIGAMPNEKVLSDIVFLENGLIKVDDEYMTNIENVYAGGDLIQSKSTVCMAIKNGKDVASIIDKKLSMQVSLLS